MTVWSFGANSQFPETYILFDLPCLMTHYRSLNFRTVIATDSERLYQKLKDISILAENISPMW
jgi:hypothetical protein